MSATRPASGEPRWNERESVPRSGSPNRRKFIQVGYSGLVGLGLPGLLAARAAARDGRRTGGRVGDRDPLERRVGPARLVRHEARSARRDEGEFKPIATAVPGIRICEHLPGLAARAGKLAIVRSMSHPEGNHLVAVHRVLTGQPSNPRGANDLDRVASRDDFPCYAAVLDRVRGRQRRRAQRRGPADATDRRTAHLARTRRRLPRSSP